ncbi:MAG: type III pantothenate kinase [Candidatus Omnitrophica bacterium]|nr:type III pantothenate kinase [Candidatus Omnitrophota bacterium]
METYLTVDIGNTAISLAMMSGQRLRWSTVVNVNQPQRRLADNVTDALNSLGQTGRGIDGAIVGSVVPDKTEQVIRIIRRGLGLKALLVGRDVTVPLKNGYRNPQQVGQDRLIGAFAAQQLYGQPAIIVDFGTAITIDVLSAKGCYEGGVIVPGIRLSLESLYSKAAMLPRVEHVRRPKTIIGKTTEHSILSGLVYGYGEMCHGLIRRIKADFKGQPKVVVTGGYARLMVSFLDDFDPIVDSQLVHKGLALLLSVSKTGQRPTNPKS